jgi:hypothetical protein
VSGVLAACPSKVAAEPDVWLRRELGSGHIDEWGEVVCHPTWTPRQASCRKLSYTRITHSPTLGCAPLINSVMLDACRIPAPSSLTSTLQTSTVPGGNGLARFQCTVQCLWVDCLSRQEAGQCGVCGAWFIDTTPRFSRLPAQSRPGAAKEGDMCTSSRREAMRTRTEANRVTLRHTISSMASASAHYTSHDLRPLSPYPRPSPFPRRK